MSGKAAPRTSFLIPVRDAESTLAAALEDVLAQTAGDFNVVVVDDGSTDGSASIAARYPVTLLRGPARGIAHALNTGLAACRGEFVARMDADDRCAPERLARQLALFRADPTLVVVDAQVEIFRDDGPIGQGMALYAAWMNAVLTPEDFDRELLIESPIAHPAATFRRDAVLAIGGYRGGPFPEDYDLWARLHASGARFRKVPEVLVRWRDGASRLTRTDPRYGRVGLRTVRQLWLKARVLDRPRRVVVVGAGKEGGPWLTWLVGEGHDVVAVDVHPGRVERAGVRVLPPDALADLDVEVGLVAVGARGARDAIRSEIGRVRPAWVEGRDWWAVR